MFSTEESKISVVILLTFALLLVTGILPGYVLFTTVAFIMVLIGLAAYKYLSKTPKISFRETQDERSAKCSLAASRNGFIVAIVLMALLAAAVSLGAPFSVITVAQIVWGVSMATYFLSYLYYKRVA